MSFVHNPTFGHPSDVFSKISYPPLAVAFGLGTCLSAGENHYVQRERQLYDESVDGNADTQYYLHDANYNVTSVWDGSQALERYSYSPYGEVTFLNPDYSTNSSQATSIGNTHFFTGRERDAETGLQLNRHRFYSSWLGRWVNRDPADYAGSRWNLYEYVQSKPLAYVDAMGERCIRCTCKSRNGRRTWTSDVDCNFTGTNKTYMDCCKEKRACWHGKDDGPPYGFGDAVGAEPCENPPTNYCRLHPEDCGKEAVFVAALSAVVFLRSQHALAPANQVLKHARVAF